MPILHMETDLVRSVGNQLQQASGLLEQQAQQFNQSVHTLGSAWQGSSADIFHGEAQTLLQQLTRLSDAGSILNQRLQHEVDEWEQVDDHFGLLNVVHTRAFPSSPLDKTDWFIGEMARNLYMTHVIGGKSEGPILESVSKLMFFFENVKTEGSWDYKNGDLRDSINTGLILAGDVYANDVPGNIMYGFMGAAIAEEIETLSLGLDAETVLLGLAGYVQINPGASKEDIARLLFDPDRERLLVYSRYLDDPLDQNAIKVGLELYRQGPSQENLESLLNSTELRKP